MCVVFLVAQLCLTLCNPMDCSPPGSSVHGDSPGKNTGVGCLALLQGIFPTQGSSPGLSHCRQILYHLSQQGWYIGRTAMPSSRRKRGFPNSVTEPRSPALQADSLPAEPTGKPKNTGVGSQSLLQDNCLTQESIQGLLHCRQILYQLSYQGSLI